MPKRKHPSIFDAYYSRPDDDLWICRNCKSYSRKIDVNKNGTSQLIGHLKNHHSTQYKEYLQLSRAKKELPTKIKKVEEKSVTFHQTKLKDPELRNTGDRKSMRIDRAILKLIASAGLPISIVDHPEFRALIRLLDSQYHLRNRKFFGSTLLNNLYEDIKDEIKKELQQQSDITLCLDEFSNKSETHALIGVSAHFLDEDFKNKHFVLGAKALKLEKEDSETNGKKKESSHSAANMARIVEELLKEFGLNKSQIFLILRDGASAVVKLCKLLDKDSSHCFAHLLQLAINDALKVVKSFDELLTKIKKFINKMRKSYKLSDAFKDAQEVEELPERVLQCGIEVRWSSLFIMVDSFVKNKEAIKWIIDDEKLPGFLKAEWDTMEHVRNSLKPFCEAIKMIQSRDASISLVIPYNVALQRAVQDNINKSIGHQELNRELLSSLKKRFSEFNNDEKYITSTLLNPCYKFNTVLFNKSLKEFYTGNIVNEICGVEETINIIATGTCFLDALDDSKEEAPVPEETKSRKQKINTELLVYFEETALPRNGSPAAYWKTNESRFPNLASLFKKYGTAPATSGEVERLFSLAGNILTDLRKHLSYESLEKLLFLNANLPLLKK